jgi:hypothetical protein
VHAQSVFFLRKRKKILQVRKSFWNPASDVTQVKMLHEREIFVICINITFFVTFIKYKFYHICTNEEKNCSTFLSNLKALKQNWQTNWYIIILIKLPLYLNVLKSFSTVWETVFFVLLKFNLIPFLVSSFVQYLYG